MKGNNIKDIIYVHLNTSHRYTISCGIEFHEFAKNLPKGLNNVLLLKHRFENSDFNMHSMFDYIEKDDIGKLLKENIASYGDFCWVDFDDIDGLNELEGQEIAELLYLGHSKQHLREPFYSKLNNRYAYLSQDDLWFNKTYYRYITDFYHILGGVVASKFGQLRGEKTFFPLKRGRDFPAIPKEMIASFTDKMREGMVISLAKTSQTRTKIEIPVWVIGDYINMDEMYEDYRINTQNPPDGHFEFDKRSREWSVYFR
ncbi:MAG TPA: hypothetical protein VEY51_18650 [Chondromyces sp.]|nr:hypothetical protein [Chondromyces sp.]